VGRRVYDFRFLCAGWDERDRNVPVLVISARSCAPSHSKAISSCLTHDTVMTTKRASNTAESVGGVRNA